ncbi:DUF86 domain-containing protein [Salinarchaeum chitinilyticum]
MVDEEIFVTKLEHIDEFVTDLEEMRGMSRAAYSADTVVQRAVERTLMNLVQACIDVAGHVRRAEELGAADTSKAEIDRLRTAGIVTEETGSKLKEAIGFRNVLAHRYGEVDHDLVFDVLHEDLHWFERFERELATWYRRERDV